MPKTCKVSFFPDDKTVEVRQGVTILAAAGQADVFVNSLCGGDGVCGRCGVIVRKGTVTGGTTDFFSHEQIQQGHILGCEGGIEADVEIEIPEHTRLVGTPEYKLSDGVGGRQWQPERQPVKDRGRMKAPRTRTKLKKGRGQEPGVAPIVWGEAMNRNAGERMELREKKGTDRGGLMRSRCSYVRDIL